MKAAELFPMETTVLPDSATFLMSADGLAGRQRTVTLAEDREQAIETLESLIAAGPVVAALPPRANMWTPEKRLAGATLASALVEIRDHHGERSHRNLVIENLRWVASDDAEWPFSFVRLCQLFELEPNWVRAVVNRWIARESEPAGQAQASGRPSDGPSVPSCAEQRRRRAKRARHGVHAALA